MSCNHLVKTQGEDNIKSRGLHFDVSHNDVTPYHDLDYDSIGLDGLDWGDLDGGNRVLYHDLGPKGHLLRGILPSSSM